MLVLKSEVARGPTVLMVKKSGDWWVRRELLINSHAEDQEEVPHINSVQNIFKNN